MEPSKEYSRSLPSSETVLPVAFHVTVEAAGIPSQSNVNLHIVPGPDTLYSFILFVVADKPS